MNTKICPLDFQREMIIEYREMQKSEQNFVVSETGSHKLMRRPLRALHS